VGEVKGAHRSYPQVASPAQFDGRPTGLTRAPDHGEQTEEILLELGRDWDAIAALKSKGAVL
jgi:crotonobetainyl-CoA:carnitine CoA-transferase CaiB-like acyl-CoA transferase